MSLAVKPYQKENILIQDATRQSRPKNDSLYLVQKTLQKEKLQNKLAIDKSGAFLNTASFDLRVEILEQSNPGRDAFENVRNVFIEKFKQTQSVCKIYGNTTTFSVEV